MLVESAPHAVSLPDAERVCEALLAYLADGADRLRLGLPRLLLLAALEVVRREEQGGIRSATRGAELPLLVLRDDEPFDQRAPPGSCFSSLLFAAARPGDS